MNHTSVCGMCRESFHVIFYKWRTIQFNLVSLLWFDVIFSGENQFVKWMWFDLMWKWFFIDKSKTKIELNKMKLMLMNSIPVIASFEIRWNEILTIAWLLTQFSFQMFHHSQSFFSVVYFIINLKFAILGIEKSKHQN